MELKSALAEIFKSAQEEFGIQNIPQVHLKNDEENYAKGIFGQTAHPKTRKEHLDLQSR